MKGKFSLMWRVGLALVLALSLSLVMAAPVAADVSGVTVTPDPTTAETAAEYTVVFTTNEYLMAGSSDKIYIEFPVDTDIAGYDGDVTIEGTVDAGVTVNGQILEITVPAGGGDIEPGSVTVILTTSGATDITNPTTAGDYTLDVWTNEEPLHVESNTYTITLLATYLTVTGTATMTAGGNNELTVTAYDSEDNVATAYAGSKTLVFSGPGVAPDGTAPTVEGVTMENEVTVNFTNGASDNGVLTLVAYKAEETTVDVSDGTVDSTGSPAYDLDLTVNPDTAAGLVYTVNPASVTAGVETTVFTVQRQDDYANPVTSGTLVVNLASDSSGADEEFRATSGGADTAAVTIAASDSTVDFYYYDELADAWTITASDDSTFNTVSTLTVDPAAIDHYTVSAITSPQVTNTAFSVTIQARDEFNNDITSGGDAAEDVTLTYNKTDAGATPSSFTTEEGIATEDVTLTVTTLGQSITFTGGTSGKTVTSSPFRVIGAVTVWVDVTNGLDDNPGTEASPFKTIAAGITAAGVGGTVNVLPGDYTPSSTLTIATDGLILQATSTAEETTIDADTNSLSTAIQITGDDVIVDGFTIEAHTAQGISIYGADGAIVRDNTITSDTGEIVGITPEAGATDVTISDNTLDNATIYLSVGSGSTVSGNSGGTINISTAFSDNVITGNTLTGIVNRAIVFNGEVGTHLNNLIEGNILSGNVTRGIHVEGGNTPTITNLTITGNTITDNGETGILIDAGVVWGLGNTISNNNISGNVFGINNEGTEVIDAQNNWWGDDSGPYHADNVATTGDQVSDSVDYRPWLLAAYAEAVAPTIDLAAGWNFISVPKRMAAATDTFGELLDGISVEVAYSYDPVSGWSAALTDADPVEVLEGYWIDVNTAGTVTLSYKEAAQEVPASKSLVGDAWNAIGFSSTTARDADTALMSVDGSWSTVLGWDAEGQAYEDSIIVGTTGNMLPGKGYWIWMTEDDVLSAISG